MRGNFNVIYNGMEYYGGHQEWLKSFGVNEFFRNRACGLAAISNVVYYYSDAEYCEILARIQYYKALSRRHIQRKETRKCTQ